MSLCLELCTAMYEDVCRAGTGQNLKALLSEPGCCGKRGQVFISAPAAGKDVDQDLKVEIQRLQTGQKLF